MKFAYLPMYDIEEVQSLTDEFWRKLDRWFLTQNVTKESAPLVRNSALYETWLDRDLLFGQTCGFPYISKLREKVQLVATPVYAVEGCNGSDYSSWIICRKGDATCFTDLAGAKLCINGEDSLSGCKALEMLCAKPLHEMFSEVVISGGHPVSVDWVREGKADLAAIDCVTWALLARYRPAALRELTIVEQGPSLPALPYITSTSTDSATLNLMQDALLSWVKQSDCSNDLQGLSLSNFEVLQEQHYDIILTRLEAAMTDRT